MEKSNLEELRQKGFLRRGRHFRNLFCRALAQLFPVNPLTDQNAASAQLVVRFGHSHTGNVLFQQHLSQPSLIGSFILEIKLCKNVEKGAEYNIINREWCASYTVGWFPSPTVFVSARTCVKSNRPLVEQGHVVGSLLRRKALHQSVNHFSRAAQDVQVF